MQSLTSSVTEAVQDGSGKLVTWWAHTYCWGVITHSHLSQCFQQWRSVWMLRMTAKVCNERWLHVMCLPVRALHNCEILPQLQQREAAALTSQLRKVTEVLLFYSLQMAMKDNLEEIWGGAGPKSTLTCKISQPCVWFFSSVRHRIRVWVFRGSRWWVFSAKLSLNFSFCHSIDDRFCVYYLW